MTKNTKNLSIRVKLPEDDNPRFQVQEEVTILWDRVIAALLLISLAIGLILMAMQYFRGIETIEAPLELEKSVSAEANTPSPPSVQLLTEAQVSIEEKPMAARVQTDSNSNLNSAAENPKTQPVEQAQEDDLLSSDKSEYQANTRPKITETTTNKTSPAEQQNAVSDTLGNTEAAIAQSETEEPNVAANTSQLSAEIAESSEEAQVKILSGRVNGAVLTTKVNGREPGPKATSQLTIPKNDLLTVYFVTEINGNRGQPVFFNWYRNDHPAAKVKISPKHDITQVMSSKYINKNMTGTWRVELVNDTGETLAESAFVVINDNKRG